MQSYKNFSLKKHNSFKLDSTAHEIWFPESLKDLIDIYKKHPKAKILGGGTNVLLSPFIDKVISLEKIPQMVEFRKSNVIVSGNYSLSSIIGLFIGLDFGGMENLFGIPGTIAGAVYMNAGSGNQSISDYLYSVTTITTEGKIKNYSKKQLLFKRRFSSFQIKNEIIYEVEFVYPEIDVDINLYEKNKEHRKQFPKFPSAGGIFNNWHELKTFKDELVGLKEGDAEVSENINIIVNKENASYADISKLIQKIQNIVKEPLDLEIKIL